LQRKFDHFDMAAAVDFVSVESNAAIKTKSAELACDIDILRSLKKSDIKTPDGDCGFWVIEQKAGQVNWQDVNSLVRPGVIRLFTYQLISRGASGVLYYHWRQSRIGNEKFFGALLPHHLEGNTRVFKEISQIGEELKLLAPAIKDTRVVAEACILYTHDNDWTLQQPMQPNKFFNLREHIQLIYNALHDRNISVDFARPTEDLSQYKIVFAPSLHLLSDGEADRLKLYVQNGGTLVSTFNTGLVNQHCIVPDTGYPNDMIDMFGLEVLEFDPIPPGEENHLTFKGAFPTSHLHPGAAVVRHHRAEGLPDFGDLCEGFLRRTPAITMNTFGLGKAIYIGTMSHQHFYHDLVSWLRQMCGLQPLLKVPENIEVSMRQKEGTRVFFLLNHQNSPVRIQFYKPMHDFLTGNTFSGNYDLPPHGVLVLDEHPENKMSGGDA
jgi:beta-galactosidase